MNEEKQLHTAQEISEGIKPTFIGIDEVAKAYDSYKDEREQKNR